MVADLLLQNWILLLVLIGASVPPYLLHRYHINRTVAREKNKERIRREEIATIRTMLAQDFHDEMGNKLATLTALVGTLEFTEKSKGLTRRETISKLDATARELFEGTRSFIWSMDPLSDEFEEIASYLNNFGSNLFADAAIQFCTSSNGRLETCRLPMGASRQIFLIFKEAMTNVIRHSGAEKVELHYSVLGGSGASQFQISLTDNGNGMKDPPTTDGAGIKNMRRRASKFGYDLVCRNNPNGGLSVILSGSCPNE